MSEYQKLVAEEALILEATEAICERMDRDDGLTRKALAARLNKSKGFITQILAGDRNMTLRTLARFADALGCKAEVRLTPIPAPPGEKPGAASTSTPEEVKPRLCTCGHEWLRHSPHLGCQDCGCDFGSPAAAPTPEQPEEPTCGRCGGAGDGRIGMFGEFIPWDTRHPKGSIQAHPCPDCSTQEARGEEWPDVVLVRDPTSSSLEHGWRDVRLEMPERLEPPLVATRYVPAERDSRLTKEQCREKLLSAIEPARQGHVRGPNPLSIEGDLFRTERESGAGVQVIALDDFNKALDAAFGEE